MTSIERNAQYTEYTSHMYSLNEFKTKYTIYIGNFSRGLTLFFVTFSKLYIKTIIFSTCTSPLFAYCFTVLMNRAIITQINHIRFTEQANTICLIPLYRVGITLSELCTATIWNCISPIHKDNPDSCQLWCDLLGALWCLRPKHKFKVEHRLPRRLWARQSWR